MNSLIVLMVFFVGLQMSLGHELKCEFEDQQYSVVGSFYSCVVNSLDNENDNISITGYSGVHKPNRNVNVVKGIWIHDTYTSFIPKNLGSLFHLIVFQMHRTHLSEIRSSDFHGMQKLEYLNLWNNDLAHLTSNALFTMPKLKTIILSWNKIENLPKELFVNNLNLEEIELHGNKIKFIGSGMFNSLLKLNIVDLNANECISKKYQGATEITQLKNETELNCKNPNEVTAITRIEFEETIKRFKNALSQTKEIQQKERMECEAKTQNLKELNEELAKVKENCRM